MVRAYKEMRKPDSEPRTIQLYCSECDEWEDEETGWTEHTVYFHRYHSRYVFIDNDHDFIFGEECEEKTSWEHEDCGNWYMNPQRDERGAKDIYVCGECGYRTFSIEEARNCCS